MIELVAKLIADGTFRGIVIFIGYLFVILLFLLLCKIEDYYEEKSLYRRNHGKENEKGSMKMKTYYIGKKYKIVETIYEGNHYYAVAGNDEKYVHSVHSSIDSAKTAWKELEDMK